MRGITRGRRAAALALAALTLLTLPGCRNGQEETAQEKKTIRVGVSVYKWDDTFITGVRTALEDQAKILEQETGLKIVMDIVDGKENQNTQNSQVERLISLGCDVLCVNIVDRYTASNIIDKAADAGLPVVFFNREPVEEDMNRWEKLYYIGTDPKTSAQLQGEILLDAYQKDPSSLDLNGDGAVSYVLLEGESSHQDSLIRTEWSIKTLKDGGIPIEKVTGGIANWERSQASALMEQWLEEYGDSIELVIANNDDMALGAIDAIRRRETLSRQPVVVGIDGTPPGLEAISQGDLMGTVACDSQTYARAILDVALSQVLGEEDDLELQLENGRYYWCPQEMITADSQ